MKILVTGATGFVGGVLCEELVKSGHSVRAIVRPTSKTDRLNAHAVELFQGDIGSHSDLGPAVDGVDAIVHVAALYREAKFPDSEYWRVNFEATKVLLEVALQKNVTRFIHTSTTGVMGSIENPPANENHPYHPGDVYQESKLEAEKLVLEWIKVGKIKGTILRPTMIWGPGDARLFKLFKGVANRTLPLIGDGETLNHYVHVADLARAYRMCLENSRSIGELFLIGGERIVTLKYTMECIAKYFGVKLLPYRIPVGPLLLMGDIVEKFCKPFGIEPPIYRRRVEFFVKSRAFDISKAKNLLDYRPALSFEQELESVAEWYVEKGWLKRANGQRT